MQPMAHCRQQLRCTSSPAALAMLALLLLLLVVVAGPAEAKKRERIVRREGAGLDPSLAKASHPVAGCIQKLTFGQCARVKF